VTSARAILETSVRRVNGACEISEFADALAVEEPLEIRLRPSGRTHRAISITMRTPGHDAELAAGFLFTEGIIKAPEQIAAIRHCGPGGNTIVAELAEGVSVDLKRLERHFYTSSSCGVCGKSSIEALHTGARRIENSDVPKVGADIIKGLHATLLSAQSAFERTGGLHASGLFSGNGSMDILREDVGRHNALDKVIGRKFLDGGLPLSEHILLVSGRASFELVQKALMAGIPVLAAVGAPSSLAVELAREFGMTLIGFVREHSFNVYCGEQRLAGERYRAETRAVASVPDGEQV
jgi:FdhD protein